MAAKKPVKKGRGLADLLAENSFDIGAGFDTTDDSVKVVELNLSDVEPNSSQPRKKFDQEKIEELALSIKAHGIFQPILVRKESGKFKIIAGERRYRASVYLNNKTIPAIVREYDDNKVLQIALLENLQRENLTAVEEAKAYKLIMTTSGITQEQLSESVGKSRSHITNLLGILNLPIEVIEFVESGQISAGHARTLSKLDDFEKIKELAKKVVNESLSVRQLEALTKLEVKKNPIKKNSVSSSKYQEITSTLNGKFGVKFDIKDTSITIKSGDLDKLKVILDLLNDWFIKRRIYGIIR